MSSSSIRILHNVALAEGEGFGTAYEYYVKLKPLTALIFSKDMVKLRNVLIAGLPERYGFSLDFVILCNVLKCDKLIVLDDRNTALDNFNNLFSCYETL